MKTLAFCFVFLLSSAFLKAQEADKSFYYDYGEKFYYEIVNLPSSSPDSTNFVVSFRIRHDVCSFQTTRGELESKGAFVAFPSLFVEFSDSTGVIRASKEWRDTVFVPNSELTLSKKHFIGGVLQIAVKAGKMAVAFELGDRSYPRSMRWMESNIDGKNFLGKPSIAQAFFVPVANTDSLRPYIMKSSVPFAANFRAIAVVSRFRADDRFSYSIRRVPPSEYPSKFEQSYPQSAEFIEISGDVKPQAGVKLLPVFAGTKNFQCFVVSSSSSRTTAPLSPDSQPLSVPDSAALGIIDINVPSATMEPGIYQLSVYRAGDRDTLKQKLTVVWENMPLSLRNFQFAVDAVKYIANDEEFDFISSGSKEQRRKRLFDFWKKKDPTPGTAYNEAMAEYYNRSDYAFFNFQTIAEKDGAKTDRGKIYILYGKPTTTERKLNPNQPGQEIWRYTNNVHKEFVFETPSPGVYILKKIKEI